MKKMVLLLSLFIVSKSIFSQTDQANLEKYWQFRNNFRKNFVKAGTESGESIPLNAYRENFECDDNVNGGTDNQNGSLRWGDSPSRIGYYLILLATEYRLLKDQGKDVTSTLSELYYALSSINRIDEAAEDYLVNQPPNLDGYYLRDDVPENFSDKFLTYRNESYECVFADFFRTDNTTQTNNPNPPFPQVYETYNPGNVPSKDQLSGILPGLAFVDKLVDNVFVKPTPQDAGFYIVNETEAITHRLITHLQALDPDGKSWTYNDLNTGDFVGNGGGDLILERYPIEKIGYNITGNFYFTEDVFRQLWDYDEAYLGEIPLDFVVFTVNYNTLAQFWAADVPYIAVQQDFFAICLDLFLGNIFVKICPKVNSAEEAITDFNINTLLTWAVLADLWSQFRIHDWAEGSGFIVHDLMHAVLHDKIPFESKGYYKQIMDGMICEGPFNKRIGQNNYVQSPGGWAAENRWIRPSLAFSGTGTNEDNQYGFHGLFSALDYMIYHNLYYLAFKDQLPEFSESYSCQCNDEIIPVTNIALNTQVVVSKKYSDYYDKNIDDVHFLSHTLDILSGGEILLEADLTICDNSVVRMISNGNITTANTASSRFGDLRVTGGSSVVLNSNGLLHVMPNTKAVFDENSILTINNGGRIIVEDNATVIIRPEALLKFNNGAIIQLNGNNAVLEIQGNLQIDNNTTFTFTGDGFVRWNTPYQPGSNVIAGTNSQIKFNGTSRTDKVLEVASDMGSGDFWMPQNLNLLAISDGMVEFKENGRLVLGCPFNFSASNFFTSTSPLVNSRGVWVAGQTGMQLNGCHFYNSDIEGMLIYGGNSLKLFSCRFFDGSHVKVDGAGYQLSNCHFDNVHTAIESQDVYLPSFYKTGSMTNCPEAISNYYTNTTVSVERVGINSSTEGYYGIYQQEGMLNLKCANVSGNFNGIFLDQGAALNASVVGNTGGYSTVSGNTNNILLSDAGMVNLDNGYNSLVPGTDLHDKIITGNFTFPGSTDPLSIPANSNKWLTNPSTDPNTNPTATIHYVDVSTSNNFDANFIDNNRGASAACAQFDPSPVTGIFSSSVFRNCATCPRVTGTFFNDVRMDEAILIAMSEMELTDSTKNDFTAIGMFNEIIAQTTLDLTDPDVKFLAKFAYEMTKVSVQNCLNTGRLTKANNDPALHPCSVHYLNVLNALREPVTENNYKEQFYLELDDALIYYWVGRYTDAIIKLRQIDNCFLGDKERRLLEYWKATIDLKQQFVTDQINIEDYYAKRKELPELEIPGAANINPTATINPSATIGTRTTIGAGTVIGENTIIGKNVIVGSNVSIDKDVIIGDNVVIGDNSSVGKETSIDEETKIGTDVSIDKESQIGANVSIANDVSVSKQVKIGDWSKIDNNASIEKETEIADGAYIGTNVTIDKQTKIGSHSIIRRNSIIEKENSISNNVIVDNNSTINKQAKIGKDVFISEGLTIGKNAKICDGGTVESNVADNSTVGSCSVPSSPTQPFYVIHDEIFAVEHAHIYGKLENGFTVSPMLDHYFVGQSITFDAKEYGSEILWDFGNCSQSDLPNTSYTFTNPGVYVITLKVSPESGCINSDAKIYIGSISVHSKPTINVESEVPACPSSEPVSFEIEFNPGDLAVPGCMSKYGINCTYARLKEDHCRLNISEDYGDGVLNTGLFTFSQLIPGVTTEHIYANTGSYNFNFSGDYQILRLTDEIWQSVNYTTIDKGTVMLDNAFDAGFAIEDFICSDSGVVIQNTTSFPGPANFSWLLSDGQSSTDAFPVFDLSVSGQYSLILVVSDTTGSCTDTITKSFEVVVCQLQSQLINPEENLENLVTYEIIAELFPNPNKGEFILDIKGLSDVSTYSWNLYDAFGKLIYKVNKVYNGNQNIIIDNIPSGIYYWQIINDNSKIKTGKLVILND